MSKAQSSRKGILMPQTVKSLNMINAKYWQSFVSEDDFFVIPAQNNEIYREISRKMKGIVKPESIYRAAKYHQATIKAYAENVLGRKLKHAPKITKKNDRRKPNTIKLLSLIAGKHKYWTHFRSAQLPTRSDKIYEELMNDPAMKGHKMSLNQVIDCIRRYKKVIKGFQNPKDADSEMEFDDEEELQKEVPQNPDNSEASSGDEDEEMNDHELRALRSMSSGK